MKAEWRREATLARARRGTRTVSLGMHATLSGVRSDADARLQTRDFLSQLPVHTSDSGGHCKRKKRRLRREPRHGTCHSVPQISSPLLPFRPSSCSGCMPRPKLRAFARRRPAPPPLQGTSLLIFLLLQHLDILLAVEEFLRDREDPFSEEEVQVGEDGPNPSSTG